VGLNHAHGRGECRNRHRYRASTAAARLFPLLHSVTVPVSYRLTTLTVRRHFAQVAWTRWPVQCLTMATPATGEQLPAGQAAAMAEVLQAATRVLTGVALRSLDVLDGTVSLPQLPVLAVLAGLGRSRSAQVAVALGLDASTVTRLARQTGPPEVPRLASLLLLL
jgi:uncharacterized membrane protein